MSKFFCCCIPVRFGVFVISLLSLAFSALGAFAIWWTLTHQGDANIVTIASSAKPAFIAEGVFFSIVALASLLGLVGALGRIRRLVSFYSFFLWGALIINAALGIWSIIKVAETFDDSVATCKSDIKNAFNNTIHGDPANSNGNGDAHNDCISAPAAKAIFISTFVIVLLVLLYGTIVVHRYKSQLNDEHRWDARHHDVGGSNKAYFNAAPVPESHPLSAQYHGYQQGGPDTPYHPVATGDYPYAAPPHSYGKTNQGV